MGLIERRVGLLLAVFFGLLALAGLRAGYFGIIKSGSLRQVASAQQLTKTKVPALRGTISDRHGVELAVSEPADDISANPRLTPNPALAAKRLAPLLGSSERDVLTKLSDSSSGFTYLAHALPAARAAKVQRIASRLGVPVQLTPRMKRVYPRRSTASQLLGVVGAGGKGLTGVELAFNGALGGSDGLRRTVTDPSGQTISIDDVRRAQPGDPVKLTIDANIQAKVEDVMRGVGAQFHPADATAIVMDPRSGEILALANWPQFDPNDLSDASSSALRDRAVSFTYEPGSTFKAFTVAGALEDGEVTPDTQLYLPASYQVADRTIHDAEERGDETLSVAQILAQSSNIGAVKIGQKLGATRFDHWVRRFGFGRPTGIALPGEERGIVLRPSEYSGSSMGNLPMGQGESVTPIQMAAAYSAVANGGVLRRPRVIEQVGGKPVREPRGRRIISPQVSASLRKMLEGVLAPGGTAHEAEIPGYSLAGKTGTANKVDPKTGTYSKTRYVASFVGFAPASDPRLLVSVVVDEPKGGIYGGQVAAPAFQKIVAFALPYLGIPPQ